MQGKFGSAKQPGAGWARAARVPLTAAILAAVLTATALWAAVAGVTFPPPHSTIFMSRDQDVALGQQAAQQARQQYPLVADSDPVAQYVRRLGQSLVQYVPEPRFEYQFHLVNQKEINAFALPGGPVFVNLGTVQAADNEAQLAGVIAHEMGHVYMRHGAELASNQMKAQLGLSVLGALLGRGMGGQLAQMGAQLLATGALLHNSRAAEAEADAVGARIMYLAGYNPQAMADFFHKLEAEGGARGPQFLSDHPDPGNRALAVSQLTQTLPPRSFNTATGQFAQAKQTAMQRQPYTAEQIAALQKQGKLSDASGSAAAPATESVPTQFKQMNHQSYTIGYPADWQVYGDASSAVTIAPPGGVGEDAVAYGVVISGFQPEARDLDGGFHELEQSLRQSNPELRVIGHDENIRVNGVAGKSVEMVGPSPLKAQGGAAQRERDWLVALPNSRGELLSLVFIAPEQDYNRLRPTFEQMLRTFRAK